MIVKWIGLALVLINTTAWSEMRTWTAQNGNTFVGEMISESDGKVSLKGRNGKVAKVPVTGLSREDQDYITFNRPINLQIEIEKSASSTNRNLHCPHVLIRKRATQELGKQLDLYVLVFGEDGKLFTHTRELDIRFFSTDESIEFFFESANFSKSNYGGTLVMIVDSAQNIVASKTTNKKFSDPNLQKRLIKHEIWYYMLKQLPDAESLTDPVRGFKGLLYDLTRRRGGTFTSTDKKTSSQKLKAYVEGGFDTTRLAQFYRSTEAVSYPAFTILPMTEVSISDLFLDSKLSLKRYSERHPWRYILNFTKSFKPESNITFRIIGQTDSLLIVGVGDKVVLSTDEERGGFQSEETPTVIPAATIQSLAFKSEWITLKGGTETRMTVLLGPNQKSMLSALLFAEEKGVEYPKNKQGGPILPLFATDQPPQQIIDFIYAGVCPPDVKPPEPFILKGIPDEQPIDTE